MLNLFTTTKITDFLCQGGRPSMKSMEICCHTLSGIGRGWRRPAEAIVSFLHIWQSVIRSYICIHILLHAFAVEELFQHVVSCLNPRMASKGTTMVQIQQMPPQHNISAYNNLSLPNQYISFQLIRRLGFRI